MIANRSSVQDFRQHTDRRNCRNQNYRVLRQGNAYRGRTITPQAGNRYWQAVKSIPAPGGQGCHAHLMRVANLGVLAGLPESQIAEEIRENIPPGGRVVPDREIADAVTKAASELAPKSAGRKRLKPCTPRLGIQFDGLAYRKKLIDRGAGADDETIRSLSPVAVPSESDHRHAITLVTALYDPQERLYMGDVYGRTVDTVERHLAALRQGNVPAHIIANPVDGKSHRTSSGKLSYRCDDAISDHRFAIVEFDDISREDQLAYWHSVIDGTLLPIAALIDSGGKSIHAWLRVDLPSKEAWDTHVRQKLWHPETGLLRLQGADSACQNPSRLSRLPGHFRSEKGRWQRLLYLDPKPNNTANRPERN